MTEFIRRPNDINGNSRYAIHFEYLLTNKERERMTDRGRPLLLKLARWRANQIGGKACKQDPEYVVFQEYEGLLPKLIELINECRFSEFPN